MSGDIVMQSSNLEIFF